MSLPEKIFLSPCLGEADLMRRVVLSQDFSRWLGTFMPQLPAAGDKWLQPVVSPDPSDAKLAHLDGLNLSRAWMLATALETKLQPFLASSESHPTVASR